MKRILFVCIHNSARSQMAEAYFNHFRENDNDVAMSAGIEPGKLNPIVVEAMAMDGIDISRHACKSVADILSLNIVFDYVITVCDAASAERCPVFPGQGQRMHWGFPDPSAITGSYAYQLVETIKIRNAIRQRVEEFFFTYHE